jgi:hypothetical protein
VSISQIRDVSIPQILKKRTENNISAPPQAAAGDIENKEPEPACSRLRRGSGSKNDEAEITKPEDLERLARMKAALGFL